MDYFDHAYHIDILLCCEVCGFHSESDSYDKILKDGFTVKDENVICPEEHPVLKRCCQLCEDHDTITSFEEFYRDWNAIKCGACEHPVKIYKTAQFDEALSDQELDVIQCTQCEEGEGGVESQVVIPFDDYGDVIGVQCVKCCSVRLIYNESMEEPPTGVADIESISRATKQEVVTWENIKDVKPGDHIEYSIHNKVVYDYEHHFFVHYVDLEAQCLFAYEMIREGIKDNCYSFKDLLDNSICRKYIYERALPFEQSVEMALSRLGEKGYSLWRNNCECFVRWLKTGVHESIQVKRAPWRLLSRIAATFGKIPIQKTLEKVGVTVANLFADDVAGFIDFGGIGAEVTMVSLVAFLFYVYEKKELKKQLNSGEITQQNFEDRLTEKKWELGGSAIGSVAGSLVPAALGFSSFGVALIGGLLGSLLLATFGSWIGKKIVTRRNERRQALKDRQQ